MANFPRHVWRVMWATGFAVAIAAGPTLSAVPGHVNAIAGCPQREVPNPRGYGCVPALAPGGAIVEAPTEHELSVCDGGNLYLCIDAYAHP